MKYKIKNWDKFQQYKDDRPIHWIKLHTSLIDDYEFDELPELSQLHLIKLWLFAAKSNGEINGSDKFIARKIGAKSINMQLLVNSGFIIRTDSYEHDDESVPRGEERREEENRGEERRERGEQSTKRFAPPSLEEIKIFIKEKSYFVDPDRFFNHYESNGWRVGKNPMKSWKAAVSSWNGRDQPNKRHDRIKQENDAVAKRFLEQDNLIEGECHVVK